MSKVQFTRASAKENEGITLRTAQLGRKFKNGESYNVVFENGKSVIFNASRNGSTLYASRSAVVGVFRKLPQTGKPVNVNIVKIRKV